MLIAALGCLWCGADASVLTSGGRTHFDRGRELYALGRWADAREEFAAVCGAVPQTESSLCAEADYYMAMCAMELKEAGAEARLAEFLRRNPESVHVNDVEFALASLLCTAGRYDEAQRAFGKVDYATLSPEHRQQYDIRMGYIRFQQGDYDDALRYFRRIPSPGEYSDHALYYISYIAYVRGDNATARAGFTELSRSAAYGAVAPFYLLQIEFNEGNYRYVVTTGGSLIDRAAGERRTELERIVAEGWFHLGDYGRTEEFLDAYRRSGGEMGRNENYLLGYSLYRQARYDEARPCLQQVCGADDALTQNASYHLADCYLRGGDKQRAMQSFAMAANEAFDAAIAEDALFNYGKLQYELGGGLFNEAIHVLNRYIAQYPTSERAVQARELLIAAYYNSRNYEAAYTALKHYPSPDGNLRAALQKIAYFRGLEAYSRGDLDGAAQSLTESAAINVSPKYGALARFWLGEIAFARGDYAEAERRYKEYLHRAPRTEDEYAKAHYNLGYCYFDRGDMSNAYASFARFNQLYSAADRYKADALNREADARYSLRQFPAALATYEKAAAVGTNEKYYADFQRAVTLGILDRRPQKIEALQRIIAADRGDYVDDATYELGRTYIAAERYDDGAKVLSKFVEENPHSPFFTPALSDLGLAYLNLGQPELSRRCYERVVESAPGSATARDAFLAATPAASAPDFLPLAAFEDFVPLAPAAFFEPVFLVDFLLGASDFAVSFSAAPASALLPFPAASEPGFGTYVPLVETSSSAPLCRRLGESPSTTTSRASTRAGSASSCIASLTARLALPMTRPRPYEPLSTASPTALDALEPTSLARILAFAVASPALAAKPPDRAALAASSSTTMRPFA